MNKQQQIEQIVTRIDFDEYVLGEFYSSTVDHQFWNGSDEN